MLSIELLPALNDFPTFQNIILTLQNYWAVQGCVIMQPYHTEVGAGTFNPATFLRCLDAEPWRVAHGAPSGLAGRAGSTVGRRPSSLISSRWAVSTSNRSLSRSPTDSSA